MSSLSNFLFGAPGGFEQISKTTPGQQSILDQILSSIGGTGGPLSSGIQNLQQLLSGSPEAFKAFEAPARTAFEQKTVPQIAERFSGLGAGSQSSSAFGQQLGAAGAGLEENLAAQRAGLQSGAMSQLQSLLGKGLESQFTTQFREPGQGQAGNIIDLMTKIIPFFI